MHLIGKKVGLNFSGAFIKEFPRIVGEQLRFVASTTKFIGKYRQLVEHVYVNYYIVRIQPRKNWQKYITTQIKENS